MTDLYWTKEKPTEEGYYFIDLPDSFFNLDGVVEVFYRPGHRYLCINDPNTCQHTKSNFIYIAKLPALWAGPIVKPLKTMK